MPTFSITLPILIESENIQLRRHWTYRHKKKQRIKLNLAWEFKNFKGAPPCKITLIRHSSRKLDHDNLAGAWKDTVDIIADLLIPGLAPGRADSDPRLTWEYQQVPKKGFRGFTIIIDYV